MNVLIYGIRKVWGEINLHSLSFFLLMFLLNGRSEHQTADIRLRSGGRSAHTKKKRQAFANKFARSVFSFC
jgi:hypothetical protein